MTGFIAAAALLALCAIGFVIWPLVRARSPSRGYQRWSALIAALLVAGSAFALYPKLSHWSWHQPAVANDADSGSIQALLQATRLHPDDVPAWLELGRGYLRAGQWALARRSYRRADSLSGGRSAAALAGLGQTIMFENNGAENEAAIELFERALKLDPHSPQALFYTAVALMHAGYLQDSRDRFATLLSLGPPAAVSDAIAKQIAGLDADIAAASTAASSSADTAIHLNIELAPALQGRVPAGASLFVFVRSPQGGAPLAAKRLAATFPQRVDLSAADSMIAGNAIRKGQPVLVVARISATGTPTASAGDLSGQLSTIAGQRTQHRLLITAPTAPGVKNE